MSCEILASLDTIWVKSKLVKLPTLTQGRRSITQQIGRTHHFAIAAFGNHFSWRNALGNGFKVVGIVDLTDPNYGNLTRMLLRWSQEASPLETIWVKARDIAEQRVLVSRNFVGTTFRELGGS